MKRGRSAESDQFYVPSSGEFPGEYDSGAENKRANTGNKENAQFDYCEMPLKSGFQKASGRNVQISEDARLKARTLLSHHSKDSNSAARFADNDSTMIPATSSSKAAGSGFQKASGNAVFISEQARSRAKSLLSSSVSSVTSLSVPDSSALPSVVTPVVSSSLRKTSGETVPISTIARANAVKLLDNSGISIESNSSSSSSRVSLLQKANGKSVIISESARQKTSHLFHDQNNENTATVSSDNNQYQRSSTAGNSPGVPSVISTPASVSSASRAGGFQKASGKGVVISEEAKARAARLFSSSNEQTTREPFPMTPAILKSSVTLSSSSFRKATGKEVTISEEAKSRAIAILDSIPESSIWQNTQTPLGYNQQMNFGDRMEPARSLDAQFAKIDKLEQGQQRPANAVVPPWKDPAIVEQLERVSRSELRFDSSRHFLLSSPHSKELQLEMVINSSSFDGHIPEKSSESDSWQLNPELKRRIALLQRFNSGNILELLGQVNPELCNVSKMCKHSVLALFSNQLPPSWLAYYTDDIDGGDNSQWKAKQLQWIVWTLASYERTQPHLYLGQLLTLPNIMMCLVHRYHCFHRHIPRTSSLLTSVSASLNNATLSSQHSLKKSSHLSALQRFQEICDWSWPLCVTISIQKSMVWSGSTTQSSSTSVTSTTSKQPRNPIAPTSTGKMPNSQSWHENSESILKEVWKLEITDGWWWIRIVLDSLLMNLIRQNKLLDGTKVIIFAAKFNAEDASCVSISYHNLRRAHCKACLGPIPRSYLTTGLSFPAIRPDGGTVFGVQFLLLGQCTQMGISYTRIGEKTQETPQSAQQSYFSNSQVRVTLSEREAELFMERVHEQFAAEQEEALLRAFHSGEIDFEDMQYDRMSKGLEQRLGSEVQCIQYLNLLVQCCHSGWIGWISLNSGNGNGAVSEDAAGLWVIGDRYFMTNLIPSKRNMPSANTANPMVLQQSRSSSYCKLPQDSTISIQPHYLFRRERNNTKCPITLVSRFGVQTYQAFPLSLLHFSCTTDNGPLSSIKSPAKTHDTTHAGPGVSITQSSMLVGSYLSISVTIVAILNKETGENILSSALAQSSKKSVQKLLHEVPLRMICLDMQGTVIHIHGTWFLAQLSCLRWMKPIEAVVRLEHVLITSLDERYAIIRVEKTEHSSIVLEEQAASQRMSIRSKATPEKGGDVLDSMHNMKWRGIEEQLRFSALQQNQSSYETQWRFRSLKDSLSTDVSLKVECSVHLLHGVQFADAVSFTDTTFWSDCDTRLYDNHSVTMVQLLLDYDTFVDTRVPLSTAPNDPLRNLPWQFVIQDTELLPTHVSTPALIIHPKNKIFEETQLHNVLVQKLLMDGDNVLPFQLFIRCSEEI